MGKSFRFLVPTLLLALQAFGAFAQPEYRVDPIVVTADRTTQRARDALSSLTVVTREEIETMHARDLGEILELATGVQVQQYGSYGNLGQVRVRGSESSHMLVLVNGIEVNDPFFGGYDIAHLDAEAIERVEVVRGTQTSLFGADAIGGVVNVILRSGRNDRRLHLSLEGGGIGYRRFSAGTGGKGDVLDYSLNVSHFQHDGIIDRDAYNNNSASARVSLHPDEATGFEFGVLYSEHYKELPFSYYFDTGDMSYKQYLDPNNHQEGEQTTVLARAERSIGKKLRSSLRIGMSTNRLRNANGPDMDPNFEDTSLNTRKLDVLLDERLTLAPSVKLLLSLQWQDESASRLDNNLYSSFSSLDRSISTTAVSATVHLKPTKRAAVLAGVRNDDPSLFTSRVSPQFKAAYTFPVTESRLRLGWSDGFRVPTLSDLYFPGFGNDELKPEKARSMELGLDQPFDFLRGFVREAELSVVLFRLDLDDMITFNDITWRSENIAEAHYSGVEIEFSTLLPRGMLRAGYTHQRTRGVEFERESRLYRRPKDRLSLFGTFEPMESLRLSAEYVYAGGQLAALSFVTYRGENVSAGDPVGGYHVINLGVGFTVPASVAGLGGATGFVRVKNALDREYETVRGYPAPGRTVIAGVGYEF